MTLTQPDLASRNRITGLDQYRSFYEESIAHPEVFWRRQSETLHWFYEPVDVF